MNDYLKTRLAFMMNANTNQFFDINGHKLKMLTFLIYLVITTVLLLLAKMNPLKSLNILKSISNNSSSDSVYIVLFWTKFYGQEFAISGNSSDGLKCNIENTCIFTNDKSLFNSSSALVFHWFDLIVKEKIIFTEYRHNNQRWVLFNRESPVWYES